MAFDFPAAPTLDQVVTFPEGPSYKWNSFAWDRQSGAATPPPITVPVITSIAPNVIGREQADTVLRVTGSGFDATSKVLFDLVEQPTTFVSATELTCPLSPVALGYSTWTVQVRTGAFESADAVTLFVILHPQINTIAPTSASIGAGPFSLTLNGDNFSVFPDYPPTIQIDGVVVPHDAAVTPAKMTATVTPGGAPRTAMVQAFSGPVEANTPPRPLTYAALAGRRTPQSRPAALRR